MPVVPITISGKQVEVSKYLVYGIDIANHVADTINAKLPEHGYFYKLRLNKPYGKILDSHEKVDIAEYANQDFILFQELFPEIKHKDQRGWITCYNCGLQNSIEHLL